MKLKSNVINAFFKQEQIELYAAIPAAELKIIQPHKWMSMYFTPCSAIVICAPYYYPDNDQSNLSIYARARDYHLYFRSLFERFIRLLSKEYPGFAFRGYADSSPFDERAAAISAGLGFIGDNGLVICPPYGSYVFLGILLSDLPYEMLTDEAPKKNKTSCLHCGACKKHCPSPKVCLSALTQKKGSLTDEEKRLILCGKMVWGCDACQVCCPLNRDVKTSPIKFFEEDRIVMLTHDVLCNMSDDRFFERAFAWRKRETIMRNLELFEGQMS